MDRPNWLGSGADGWIDIRNVSWFGQMHGRGMTAYQRPEEDGSAG